MLGKEQQPSREVLTLLVAVLGTQFVQRRDVYARQLADGRYVSVKKPLKNSHLFAHLRGDITLGAYVLSEQSRSHFLVFDADDAPDWRRLKALAAVLDEQGTVSYLEPSRRGGHLWLFFDTPLTGKEIRTFGKGLLGYFSIEGIELFPKQEKLTSGPGSLIRLPFGIHRRSNRRYGFYLPDSTPLAPTLREQIQALSAPETVSKTVFDQFLAYVPAKPERGFSDTPHAPRREVNQLDRDTDLPLWEQIRAAITVRQFVLRHVELSPSGMGLCPFHDDHNPSLSVNDEKNYWYCFACEEGGDVIKFWMKWQGYDFNTLVEDVAEMLLLLDAETE